MAPAIEAAEANGGDWRRAVADTGVDADFYVFRDRSHDEVLPWSIIDGGMKETFFRSELDKSFREEWTLPPKRAAENAKLTALTSKVMIGELVGRCSPSKPPSPPLNALSATAICSSCSRYAWRIRSRRRSWAVESVIGRSSAKLRRSPLTEYWRAGNVTFRPLPLRRSQTAKPTSFKP